MNQYYFNINDFDVEAMFNSGRILSFDYKEENGVTFMTITTSCCCDDWFS